MFSLEGKNAIITGGASGIGEAISKRFASEGANVSILELSKENGEKVVESIIKENGKAEFFQCDVSNHKQVAEVVSQVHEKNTIDILVNNAGIGFVGNLEKTQEEDLDRLYNVNVKGVYNCLHAVVPKMKGKGGVVINMASIASSVALADRFAYGMTKGAVLTMTYSIAKDYINDNIRCNCISPARVHTSFVDNYIAKNYPGKEKEVFEQLSKTQPIGRMAKAEEVANLALYLCSDEAKFITGTDFPIDGGFIKLNG